VTDNRPDTSTQAAGCIILAALVGLAYLAGIITALALT